MTPVEKDAADRAVAFDLHETKHQTFGQIGKRFGVSRETARQWVLRVRAERAGSPPPVVPAVPPPAAPGFMARLAAQHGAVPAVEPDEPEAFEVPRLPGGLEDSDLDVDDDAYDAMSLLKKAIRANLELARNAAADQNMTIVSRCNRDLLGLVNHLKGLEKAQRTDENTLHVSRADIDIAYASVLEKARAVCEKPLLCAECGKQIAIRMAEGKT